MARKTAVKSDPSPEAETGTPSPLNLAVRRSGGIRKASKTREFNPTEEAVKASLTEGALAFDVASEEEARKVLGLLRSAATANGLGLDVNTLDQARNADGSFTIDFKARPEKRERKYTAADIRAWAMATHGTEVIGPIPKELRDAFKVANGYAKSTTQDQNNNG